MIIPNDCQIQATDEDGESDAETSEPNESLGKFHNFFTDIT